MIAVAFAIALASAPAAADIGPRPTMEEFIALAEPALAGKLKKQQSVTFEWPYRLAAGPAGYFTCGLAGSKRKSGRGKGVWVSAVVARGRVASSQWSTLNGMLAWDCKRNIRAGIIAAR